MQYIQNMIILILVLSVLLLRVENAYQLTLLFTVFTRMAFVNINNDSILVYHILTLILLIRVFILDKGNIKILVPKLLIAFVLYMGISIFFALFCGDTFVINVNTRYARVQFGPQQFTQYIYLLFAVFFMIMTSDLLARGRICMDTIWKTLDVSYVLVILLGFLQLFIPIEEFDYIFRNSMTGSVVQTINGTHRIDSVFGEPSMMMLFVTPLFCKYGYDIISGDFSLKKILLVILGLLTVLQNQSSSFVLGVLTSLVVILLFTVKDSRNIKIRALIALAFFALIAVIFFYIFHSYYQEVIDVFLVKIRGEGVSGSERAMAAALHFQVFLNHFLFGVGFGTLRSYDLITGWLAQGGCIGITLYLGALFALCYRLWKNSSQEDKRMAIVLVSYNAIMMVSVPEFCQIHIWVYYAMAQFLISSEHTTTIRRKAGGSYGILERRS